MRSFNHKKAVQALNYIAQHFGETTNKMKALKLIWLSDRLSIRRTGRTITGDQYFAMKNGPVASGTRDILELSNFLAEEEKDYSLAFLSNKGYDYSSKEAVDLEELSVSDRTILDQVIQHFGEKDAFTLSEISHSYPEWKRHEAALNVSISTRILIDPLDFFIDIPDQNELFNSSDPEDLEFVKSIYLSNKEILDSF